MSNSSGSPIEPTRVVLDGVRRVGFGVLEPGRDVEGCPFPSCLSACLEFMGEDYGYSTVQMDGEDWRENNLYIYLMGVSGAAFRLSWRPGWHLDNVEIVYMSTDPAAPFDRAFEAVGYAYEVVSKEEGRDNRAYFGQRIVESLRDRGRPLLGFGLVGPPECGIITGYDAGGDVLLGWSYFQDLPPFNAGVEFEPSGYFRRQDWFESTQALIVIGEKIARPPLAAIDRQALQWALTVARAPLVDAYDHARHNGLAAYVAWADALSCDDDFLTDDMAALRHYHMVHNDAVGVVAEGRWYAAQFLEQIAAREPAMAQDLTAATACYRAEHDLMWKTWHLVGGTGFADAQVQKLAEAEVRRQIVPIILQARDQDAEAADYIERALTL